MSKVLTWKEIVEKYPKQWVAISNFSEDPIDAPEVQGEVYAFAENENDLADVIDKKGGDLPLAIEFTGERLVENWHGGLWPQPTE